MFIDFETVKIFVKPGVSDLRKATNGLCIIIEEEMELSALSGSLFLFCNRDRRLLKAVYWDGTGFWLMQKRLEVHQFPWPKTPEAAREIDLPQLKMLLSGIDFWRAHENLSYESVI